MAFELKEKTEDEKKAYFAGYAAGLERAAAKIEETPGRIGFKQAANIIRELLLTHA